ncbi:MAG: carboxy-S-adenosyl-L-methionine synthase CmoA [Thermodesulfobacteriota bacterium]
MPRRSAKKSPPAGGQFQFDETVAAVFDDMLTRSVPFYHEIQRMLVEMSDSFAQPGSTIYDLGCATGTTLVQLATGLPDRGLTFCGVDSSAPVLARAREKLDRHGLTDRCRLIEADLNDFDAVTDASVVICNLTLQFVRPLFRDRLIRAVYQGLRERGALLLVEKVLGNESAINRMFVDFYYGFKRGNGYSDMEIAAKREALENVLIPYKLDENLTLLRRNGFELVDTFFKWYNFAGILAIKHPDLRQAEPHRQNP